mgnify:CR=1 FL=1
MRDAKKMIHIRVNDKLHESLIQRAKDTNRTMSQYIRDILSTSNHPLEVERWRSGLPLTIQESKDAMERRDEFGRRVEINLT